MQTWLYRIAVNEALQFRRRAKLASVDPQTIAARTGRSRAPDSGTLRMDLEEALAALSPADRAILLLRYQEGLDYQAIGEITNLPLGTVASRLNRARARIRGLLKKDYGAQEETAPASHPMD